MIQFHPSQLLKKICRHAPHAESISGIGSPILIGLPLNLANTPLKHPTGRV